MLQINKQINKNLGKTILQKPHLKEFLQKPHLKEFCVKCACAWGLEGREQGQPRLARPRHPKAPAGWRAFPPKLTLCMISPHSEHIGLRYEDGSLVWLILSIKLLSFCNAHWKL